MTDYTDGEKRAAVALLREAARIGFVSRHGIREGMCYALRSALDSVRVAIDSFSAEGICYDSAAYVCANRTMRLFQPDDAPTYWFPLTEKYDDLRCTILLLAADMLESDIGEAS